MKKKIAITLGVLLIVGVVFFAWTNRKEATSITNEKLPKNYQVILRDTRLDVRLVDTEETQEQGLSGFKKLEESEGMFFLFSYKSQRAFWMKDMNFPIDVLWLERISEKIFHVVGVHKNIPPESFPEIFTLETPVDAFLEIPANSVDNISKEGLIGEMLVLNKI